ncbi:UvrD-helicase domain-containing protein [Ectobacillus polymachus]|uniref:UvrD-helicase domain-containing protein n=1 Tax=Ectobacillus polymachus TaxID=1508806 RepID=UPI003A878DDD
MDVALYQDTTIHLHTYPRELFQRLYEASLKHEVTCPSCHKPVKLYLGIAKQPHFYHISSAPACKTAIFADSQQEIAATSSSIELGGFRLPKSRTIQEKKSSFWKIMQPVTNIPQFTTTNKSLTYHVLNEEQFPLDSSQYAAVTCTEGPLLILAGAGSGKTRVLTARTAYMIKEMGIDPKSIMLVTFTSKAAKEMKARLQRFSSVSTQALRSIVMGTFHSIFYKMLLHYDPTRWSPNALLKYSWQIERILKIAGAEIGLDEKEFPYDQSMSQISYWKNTLVSYDHITPKNEWEEQVLYLYKRYEEQKSEQGQFDFDDMLLGCYDMLQTNKELLSRYQQRFQYFLIDEFQDINKVQYEIMKLLSHPTNNICAVGDDDQSIYSFRGSDPSFILHFDHEFKEATVITLHENYRSSHSIVATANKVITRNKKRRPKMMNAQFHLPTPPAFFFPYDEEEEATMIVNDMKEKMEKGANPSSFAILYRTHSASRAVFERLCQSAIPFVIERDAESFYKRRIARYLLSYMRLSINEEDTSAIADLLSALFLKQSVLQELKRISILEDCTLVSALAKLSTVKPFQQKKLQRIVPFFRKLRNVSPSSAIEMIEKDMGFSEFIKKRGGEGNQMEKGSDDLRDMKVIARKFQTLDEFLAHADHMMAMNDEMKKLSQTYTDAASLLTIHRAKGLEYKYVYLLGGVDGSLPHDYALESFREGDIAPLEEERRLAYVAMTRAQEMLYVSVPMTRRGKTTHPSRFFSSLF